MAHPAVRRDRMVLIAYFSYTKLPALKVSFSLCYIVLRIVEYYFGKKKKTTKHPIQQQSEFIAQVGQQFMRQIQRRKYITTVCSERRAIITYVASTCVLAKPEMTNKRGNTLCPRKP